MTMPAKAYALVKSSAGVGRGNMKEFLPFALDVRNQCLVCRPQAGDYEPLAAACVRLAIPTLLERVF
jgi:hypothetical protein